MDAILSQCLKTHFDRTEASNTSNQMHSLSIMWVQMIFLRYHVAIPLCHHVKRSLDKSYLIPGGSWQRMRATSERVRLNRYKWSNLSSVFSLFSLLILLSSRPVKTQSFETDLLPLHRMINHQLYSKPALSRSSKSFLSGHTNATVPSSNYVSLPYRNDSLADETESFFPLFSLLSWLINFSRITRIRGQARAS